MLIFYDLSITNNFQTCTISQKPCSHLAPLFSSRNKEGQIFLLCLYHRHFIFLSDSVLIFYCGLPSGKLHYRGPTKISSSEIKHHWIALFQGYLNSFLKNCLYSDCQFSAWEVYDQIVSGSFQFGFFLLLEFETIC